MYTTIWDTSGVLVILYSDPFVCVAVMMISGPLVIDERVAVVLGVARSELSADWRPCISD